MFSYALLLLVLAVIPAWGAGANPDSSKPIIITDPQSSQGFAAYFNLLDRSTGLPRADWEYSQSSRSATALDESKYYDKMYSILKTRGLERLKQAGPISSAAALRSHPNYVDFYDGSHRTPAAYLRLADIIPDNPLSINNPDVAIFMHRTASIFHQTALAQWLEPKQIIRGASLHSSSSNQLAYHTVWEHPLSNKQLFWMSDLKEIYRWPVLPDMERLGYNPSTIQDEIHIYSRAKPPRYYEQVGSFVFRSLVLASSRYMEQFDRDPRSNNEIFNTFALVFSPIDRRQQARPSPWFQAPLFRNFDPDSADKSTRVVLNKYQYRGRLFPDLDRVRYILSTDSSDRPTLIPISIVRPVQVIPSVKFETVITIPEELRKEGAVSFSRIRADTVRLVQDPGVFKIKLGGPSNRYLFGKPRPLGHPLYYVESRGLDREVTSAEDPRAVAAADTAHAESSSRASGVPRRHSIPTTESAIFSYQPHSQDQQAEASLWVSDNHPQSSQHLRDEVARIGALGHNNAPPGYPVAHTYPQAPAYAHPGYGGYGETAVEQMHVDQPVDPGRYVASSHTVQTRPSRPPVRHDSTPANQSPYAPMDPELLREFQQHMDPVEYGWRVWRGWHPGGRIP
ncbi:hypothetical protein EX895_003366 [Sporisorium graminicola]|uniref:Tyrosinase copper-binding domain-containing protein n=1 Tax=Sporisorium graminicola TaxID=280036 RepID=A0A4U7KT65_9BASI|nr:hypothetical protein EX895_003366 [Sporisorium graminicola]TKY87785.1 hypothetical protein EX895_003366 [Sporisorium graminicola]